MAGALCGRWRRRNAGDTCPRRGFAGVEQSGAPGAYSGRGLAVEHARGTCSPPGVRVGFGEVRSAEFGGHGGSGRRGLAGAGGSVTPGGYGYQIWCVKIERTGMWLTEGAGRSGSQRRGLTTTTGGGAEAVLADGVQRRSSWRLDPSRRCANKLLTRIGDQRGPRVKGGEQLPETDSPATMGMGTIPAMA